MRAGKYRLKSILILVGSLFILANAASAAIQKSEVYKDPAGKYELLLPPNWKAVDYVDGAGNARVDIIYRDRSFGLLKITQEGLNDVSSLEQFIKDDVDQNLRFRPGYVYGGVERFVGEHASGNLLEFNFTQAGQPKKARNYYLRKTGSGVWTLRFAGNSEVMGPLRRETDQIARSFKPLG